MLWNLISPLLVACGTAVRPQTIAEVHITGTTAPATFHLLDDDSSQGNAIACQAAQQQLFRLYLCEQEKIWSTLSSPCLRDCAWLAVSELMNH